MYTSSGDGSKSKNGSNSTYLLHARNTMQYSPGWIISTSRSPFIVQYYEYFAGREYFHVNENQTSIQMFIIRSALDQRPNHHVIILAHQFRIVDSTCHPLSFLEAAHLHSQFVEWYFYQRFYSIYYFDIRLWSQRNTFFRASLVQGLPLLSTTILIYAILLLF